MLVLQRALEFRFRGAGVVDQLTQCSEVGVAALEFDGFEDGASVFVGGERLEGLGRGDDATHHFFARLDVDAVSQDHIEPRGNLPATAYVSIATRRLLWSFEVPSVRGR